MKCHESVYIFHQTKPDNGESSKKSLVTRDVTLVCTDLSNKFRQINVPVIVVFFNVRCDYSFQGAINPLHRTTLRVIICAKMNFDLIFRIFFFKGKLHSVKNYFKNIMRIFLDLQ